MLEVTDDVSTEIETSNPAPESAEVTTQDTDVDNGGEIATQAPETAEAEAIPAYVPNFKYTVGGKEKEVDEMFRSLITDAEKEKKIREVFERADGLDLVKQSRAEIKTHFDTFKEQAAPHLQTYDKFVTLRDNGSLEALDAALKVAGIDEDKLFELMVRKLEAEKNPHLNQMHQGLAQNHIASYEQQNQLSHFHQMQSQQQTQALASEVSDLLGNNKDVVSQIESILGKENAIADEMIQYGGMMMEKQNKFVSPQEAFEAVTSKYMPFLSRMQAPASQAMQAQAPAHQPPATLPVPKGASAGVVKTLPKTMADLRKMANEAT